MSVLSKTDTLINDASWDTQTSREKLVKERSINTLA